MLRLERFSRAGCQQLLDRGYTHFVIRNEHGNEEADNDVITLEPVKLRIPEKAISIREFMNSDSDGAGYYVMFHAAQIA